MRDDVGWMYIHLSGHWLYLGSARSLGGWAGSGGGWGGMLFCTCVTMWIRVALSVSLILSRIIT